MDPSTLPTKCPDADNGTPPHIQPTNSSANAFLKKHLHHHAAASAPPDVALIYRECLKNHAASLGGHALDGCGEFMPSPTANPADPTSLKCAACCCHRNFHRREPDDHAAPLAAHFLDFRHRGHPPPPLPPRRISPSPSPSPSRSPPSPPPSYYPSATHILLALGTAVPEDHQPTTNHHQVVTPATPTALKVENPSGRKRFRTKFSQEQKEKMLSFSEKLGWKMNKCDEGLVEEFCNEVGVGKTVLKVWMHNNKNTFGKRDITTTTTSSNHHHHSTNGRVSLDNIAQNTIINNPNNDDDIDHCHKENSGVHLQVSTNGSSSSS